MNGCHGRRRGQKPQTHLVLRRRIDPIKKNQSLLSGDPYIHPSIHHCESTRRCRYTTHAQAQFAPCGHTAQVLFGPELVVVVVIKGTCTLATAPPCSAEQAFLHTKSTQPPIRGPLTTL